MNILITGADGFIGSHLVDYLINKNHKVTALSYYNSFNNLGWLNGKKNKNLKILSGDIRDQNYCLKNFWVLNYTHEAQISFFMSFSFFSPCMGLYGWVRFQNPDIHL